MRNQEAQKYKDSTDLDPDLEHWSKSDLWESSVPIFLFDHWNKPNYSRSWIKLLKRNGPWCGQILY